MSTEFSEERKGFIAFEKEQFQVILKEIFSWELDDKTRFENGLENLLSESSKTISQLSCSKGILNNFVLYKRTEKEDT